MQGQKGFIMWNGCRYIFIVHPSKQICSFAIKKKSAHCIESKTNAEQLTNGGIFLLLFSKRQFQDWHEMCIRFPSFSIFTEKRARLDTVRDIP